MDLATAIYIVAGPPAEREALANLDNELDWPEDWAPSLYSTDHDTTGEEDRGL